MSQIVKANDPRITWQGAISLRQLDDRVMPWRLPHDALDLYPPQVLQERAAMPAGVRLSFMSDTTSVSGNIAWFLDPSYATPEDKHSVDVYCDGESYGTLILGEDGSFHIGGLPANEKLVELWLPHYAECKVGALELDDGASLSHYKDTRPKWVTYGSSITHCRAAESTSNTWPAIVAREAGLNLTDLGYAGNCHLEPMVARMIRELPADFLSIKVGINVQTNGSMNIRTFRSAVIGFVKVVREKHPDTPFAVSSPIFCPLWEETRNAAEFNLQDMRVEIAEAVESLKAHGDKNLHYIDGLKLFGTDLGHMLPDDLHPNAEGYKLLAQNFLREVANPIFKN